MTIHTIHQDLLTGPVNIALVGAGGNGSQMLTGLARLHTALLALQHPGGLQVTVYDPDRVSESNVGRQLFSPSDIGQYKASVLVHRLNCYYGLDWQARPSRFTLPARGYATHMPDIVVSCVDTIASRQEISKLLGLRHSATPRYWLDLGNRQQDGQVILGEPDRKHGVQTGTINSNEFTRGMNAKERKAKMHAPPRLPTVMEVYPELMRRQKEDDAPSCSLAEALEKQDLFINDHVTRWGLHLLWTLFREGKVEHHGYLINLKDGSVNPLTVPGKEKR